MIILHAQPYDISAPGFLFKSVEEYREKADKLTNSAGDPVEEFEIQFIDGEDIDRELFKALNINQATSPMFFEKADEWENEI